VQPLRKAVGRVVDLAAFLHGYRELTSDSKARKNFIRDKQSVLLLPWWRSGHI